MPIEVPPELKEQLTNLTNELAMRTKERDSRKKQADVALAEVKGLKDNLAVAEKGLGEAIRAIEELRKENAQLLEVVQRLHKKNAAAKQALRTALDTL